MVTDIAEAKKQEFECSKHFLPAGSIVFCAMDAFSGPGQQVIGLLGKTVMRAVGHLACC